MLTAITRAINPAFADCELTFLSRKPIDVARAEAQHRAYCDLLETLGCRVIELPTDDGLADSVFIEDTALVLDELAVSCRPGAPSRQAEVAAVAEALREHRRIAAIEAPGTVDGGDLLHVGDVIYAGLSTRTSQAGIDQLAAIVADYGIRVVAVETAECLHLKSAVSQCAAGTLLINPGWIDATVFGDWELVDVDPLEAHAANALLLDGPVIYPTSFPRTLERLVARGIDVHTVDVSELQKAEGAVTCCSLILR